jgi:hypothetical protein
LVAFTNGKELILVNASASVVRIATWFNHLDVLRMVTAPADRILSRYLEVTGKSVLSIAIKYRFLRSKDLAVRNSDGVLSE